MLTFFIILLLLACSAFFSGSETGLTAVTRARIHRLEMEGDRRAGMVNRLRRQQERLIGAILLGNNLVNIAASALATSMAIHWMGEEGVAVATLGMTLVVLIFAEVLPKTFAIRHPERVALAVAPVFLLLVRVLGPFAALIQWLVGRIFALFGEHAAEGKSLISSAEVLRGTVELYHKEGGIIKTDRDMLGGILDLAEVTVEEVMVHRRQVIALDAGRPADEIAAEAFASPHSRLPLWRDTPDNIVGILHVRDLLRHAMRHGGASGQVDWPEDISTLAAKPWFVPENTPIKQQLQEFREKRRHFALVVDEYGDLQGLVTLKDILEEIVGEMDDEHDRSRGRIRQQTDGTVIVRGDMTIRDLNRELDWSLPDDHATTLAGLVIHEAGLIPEPGDYYTFHGITCTVLRKTRNQITSVKVEKQPENE